MRRVAHLFLGGVLLLSLFSFSTAMLSSDASAASLSGTWSSRISGQGYTQTYLGPGGETITDSFDAELDLSESGGVVTGTVTAWDAEGSQTFEVDGTFDGTTFLMTAYYGWDGVSWLAPVYTLTVDGDRMYGSASYLNVGVTIYGYFDLVKGSGIALGLGEYTEVIAGGSLVAGVVGLVALVLPTPKPGFRPAAGQAAYGPPSPTPSVVGETNPYAPTGPPEAGQPQGGAGITYGPPDPTIWTGPGAPPSPREWYSSVSQQSPQCPAHQGTHTTPHFKDVNDPGSWYCPKCNGYPWGGAR